MSFHPSRGIFFRVFQVCGGLPPTKLEITWGGTSPEEKTAAAGGDFFYKKVGRQWGAPHPLTAPLKYTPALYAIKTIL